jgi:hypothetical protein
VVRAVGTSSKLICSNLDILLLSSEGKKRFKLDPEFPSLHLLSNLNKATFILQSILEDYSKRYLSEPTDRVVALSGLAARVANVLECEELYGIFDLYLHRNLLWRRSSLDKMKRIEYKSLEVPSWSWMAYTGGIKFIDVDYGTLEVFNNLRFAKGNKKALITNVWEFGDCHLKKEEATRYQILDSCGTEIGWIMYDIEDGKDLRLERSVVVGRTCQSDGSESNGLDNRKYHILIVRQRAGNEYERVGIGTVQHGYISQQQPDICIL